MEPTAEELGIDLFGSSLPSMDEIEKLSVFVHSSERNQLSFAEQVEDNLSKTGQKAALAVGIGLFMLSKTPKQWRN